MWRSSCFRQLRVRQVGAVHHESTWLEPPSSPIGASSDRSRPSMSLLHLHHLAGLHAQLAGDGLLVGPDLLGAVEPLQLARVRARLKNNFRWAWVVPSFTSDQLFKM